MSKFERRIIMSNIDKETKISINSVYGLSILALDSARPENWDSMSKEEREECVRHVVETAGKKFGEPKCAELTIPIRRWKAIKYAAR